MSNLFRKKSLERISSPEQLNSYIRVSTPSVWMLLTAIVLLLIGVCVWGVFGHMDTTLPVLAVSQEGAVTAYVRQTDADKIAEGAAVSVGDAAGNVLTIAAQPQQVGDTFTDYMCHVGNLQAGEWVCAVTLGVDCPDGVYSAQIVIDSVPPMSFVLN